MTHPTQDEAYLKKLQLYIIFVERPVSSSILSTGLYFLLEKWRKNNTKKFMDYWEGSSNKTVESFRAIPIEEYEQRLSEINN